MFAARGSSLVELLVALAVLGIAAAASAAYLLPAPSPVDDAVATIEGATHAARLQAMASGSALRIRPDEGVLVTERAEACGAATWTAEPDLAVSLPSEVTMSPENWTVCFGSRGGSDTNLVIELAHPDHPPRRIEILLGGTTRIAS